MFRYSLNSHSTAWRVDLHLQGANVSSKIDTGADICRDAPGLGELMHVYVCLRHAHACALRCTTVHIGTSQQEKLTLWIWFINFTQGRRKS